MWLRFNLQQFAHQRVDVDAVKWLRQVVLLKVGSKGPEDGLHVHIFVIEAMVSSVDIDDESLVGNKNVKTLILVICYFLTIYNFTLPSSETVQVSPKSEVEFRICSVFKH